MKMNSRIHACLDADLPRRTLSTAEEEDLAAMEQDLVRVVGHLRTPPPVDLRAGVMQRLPELTPSLPWGARLSAALLVAWAWFGAPRPVTLQLRPSYAFAAIVLLSLLPLAAPRSIAPGETPVAAAAAAPVYVQFRLDAAQATSVSLAGSFSEWQPAIQLRENVPGVWTATVPLSPGVYDYLFVVDGAEWVPDPAGALVEDDFGGTNSRLYLTLPTSAL